MYVPLLWDRSSSLRDPRLTLWGEDADVTFSWLPMTKGSESVEMGVGIKLAFSYMLYTEGRKRH